MSMFKTIQLQSRIITLFTHNAEAPHAQGILTLLRANHDNKYNIQISQNFPTKDQLEYLAKIDKPGLIQQVPKAELLLMKVPEDSVFGSPLKSCVEKDYWNKNTSLWVDWEKALLGTSVQSVKDALDKK